MGPCFRGMENAVLNATNTNGQAMLQWGHALGAWKTRSGADISEWREYRFNGAML